MGNNASLQNYLFPVCWLLFLTKYLYEFIVETAEPINPQEQGSVAFFATHPIRTAARFAGWTCWAAAGWGWACTKDRAQQASAPGKALGEGLPPRGK